MRLTILPVFLFLLNLPVMAQSGDAVLFFRAEELSENVFLTWAIKQGFTCDGVDVLRSSDSVNFVKIGDIEGICGSSAASISYDFTDLFPEKNSRNYYRLSLGGVLFSNIISIDIIDIPANNYLVVPNPFVENSRIYFENAAVAMCELSVFSPHGTRVHVAHTNGEVFDLSALDFTHGVYFFEIVYENGKHPISGRFAVP